MRTPMRFAIAVILFAFGTWAAPWPVVPVLAALLLLAAPRAFTPGLLALAATRGEKPPERAFWAEVILDGLHQSVKLARQDLDSTIRYKEMLKFQLLKPQRRGPQPTGLH